VALFAVAACTPALAHRHRHSKSAPVPEVKAQKYDALAKLTGQHYADEINPMASPSPAPVVSCAEAEAKIAAAYRESVTMRAGINAQQQHVNVAMQRSGMANNTLMNSTDTVKLVSLAIKESFEKGQELLESYTDADIAEKNQTESSMIALTSAMYNTLVKTWHAAVIEGHNNQLLAAQNLEFLRLADIKLDTMKGQLLQLHEMTERYSECEEKDPEPAP